MKKKLVYLFCLPLIVSCCKNDESIPDVSGIKVELQVHRFEKDFFAADTNDISGSMRRLSAKYPVFLKDFLGNILGIPMPDSNPDASFAIKKFLADYKPVKDSSDLVFKNFDVLAADVKKGLQFLKYYFPSYNPPQQLITFIGPMDAFAVGTLGGYGDIITTGALGAGLQLHLGKNSSYYNNQIGQQLYPSYISQRFELAYIPVNCMKNIIDDMYPDQTEGKSLLEIAIDRGKRLYILDLLLPHTADTLKIGYTQKQLQGCIENEGLIWNFLADNNLVYETDFLKIKSYISDGPKTAELGDGSPGYISLFTGRQIIREFMKKFPDTKLQELMLFDSKKILNDSKYKPK